MQDGMLRWYGHVVRSKEYSVVKTAMCLDLMVDDHVIDPRTIESRRT